MWPVYVRVFLRVDFSQLTGHNLFGRGKYALTERVHLELIKLGTKVEGSHFLEWNFTTETFKTLFCHSITLKIL